MASSTLHLVVDKGPKQGETLARKPGTVVRIGRVVKGNTFAIKDPAISQKHLLIEFASDFSMWTATDLDTSNGTLVNDVKVPPAAPFPLSDGDTIKIGETTSISVKIDAAGGEVEGGLRRRGPARSKAESLASVAEEEGMGEVEEPKESRRGRGRPRRADAASRVSKKDETLEEVVEDCAQLRPRRGRSSRVLTKGEAVEEVVEVKQPRRTRRQARGATAQLIDEERADSMKDLKEDELNEAAEDVKKRKPRKAPARTRASTAKSSSPEEVRASGGEGGALGVAGEEKENRFEEERVAADGEGEEPPIPEGEERVEEEPVVDLEKMTLGEWFDSMEKYLPQSINEVAEQMITELREKARLYNEYITNVSMDG